MKKIMFNDKYGLTQAVLEGRKTQTRRIARISKHEFELLSGIYPNSPKELVQSILRANSKYKIGEIVAIAQSYKDCGYDENALDISPKDYRISCGTLGNSKGWNNKMFVRSEACKHQIRITNVRVECLQNISDEDCLKEGIEFDGKAQSFYCGMNCSTNSKIWLGYTPREAYSALIDKVGKKGDWERNPFVFVYDFKLVK